jgi:hypothetical protein
MAIVSIDTKKKEQVALFKNAGKEWAIERRPVMDHDFPSDAKGIAIPYGIYMPIANAATVFVGTSHDTPEFAVDCLAAWWQLDGRGRFPSTNHLLVLADSGGSNGARCRAWKYFLQQNLCDVHQLTVTVAHYPSGASKWNPMSIGSSARSARTGLASPQQTLNVVAGHDCKGPHSARSRLPMVSPHASSVYPRAASRARRPISASLSG